MKIFNEIEAMNNTVVAFGCFDGIHIGHRKVLAAAVSGCAGGLTSVVLSLDASCMDSEAGSHVIYTEEEKAVFLEKAGIDVTVSVPLDSKLSGMAAEDFIRDIICGKLGAVKIVAGDNVAFGKDRRGNISLLKEMAAECGYELAVCGTELYEGKPVSSERVKKELTEGDLEKANELLGHPFTIYGEVVHGKALGRTVGMPTANLKAPDNKIMPKFGVYGTLSEINGEAVKGLTNIGQRPSVDDHSYVTIETFLLDFASDIYGQKIALQIHAYIRGVVKFPDLEAVKTQVDKDLQAIRSKLDSVCLV